MADSLVIIGPTASGKTGAAVAAAQRLGGEIISMDSRQVYRGMDIGTAKPTPAERGGIAHHGFDLVDPGERFNAGDFARYARALLAEIRSRGRLPILVGGTGFFLRALLQPMFREPHLDPSAKEAWKRYLAGIPDDRLRRWAEVVDPAARAVRDRQRLARIVELAMLTGRPLSWWQRNAAAEPAAIDPCVIVLDLPRDLLVERIERRVDVMIADGLVAEVRRLLAAGYDERSPGMNATGYSELIPHIRGDRPLEESVELIRIATRQYARRQVTWLRHQLPAHAVRVDARGSASAIADRIVAVWEEGSA